MARFGHSLPKEKLGGIGMPSWLPDWLTGKDVREIQGPVYIPPRGKAGGYRKELAADIARKAKDPFTQRDIYSAVQAGADFVPLMGEDVGVRETAEDWKKGNRISAIAGGLGTALGIVPVVGDVGGKLVKEGGKKLTKGLGEVSEHLPNVEKTASAVVDPVAPQGLGIRAYHGSPHSFEQFDISKIGTGEGAQAYGHGLYFAENEGVAKSYRDTLGGRAKWNEIGFSVDELLPMMGANTPELQSVMRPYVTRDLDRMIDFLDEEGGGIEAARAIVAKKGHASGAGTVTYPQEMQEAVAQKLAAAHAAKKGHMYEVDIAADPDAFLDWDKPLSEQPHLLPAMNQAGYSVPKSADLSYLEKMAAENGPDSWYALQLNAMKPQIGKPASEFVPRTAETAEALKQAGIPGIRYLDQGSRGKLLLDGKPIAGNDYVAQAAADAMGTYGSRDAAIKALGAHPGYKNTNKDAAELLRSGRLTEASGSRNYVVFDPKLISIVKKYGLAAAISAGLISEEMGRQMQQQGEL